MTLAQAATNSQAAFDPTEAAIRNLLFPFIVLVAGFVVKGVSDIRRERLAHVRIVDGMLEEIETIRKNWSSNQKILKDALEGGDESIFAKRIDEDAKYYPYIVTSNSSGLVFAAEEKPVVAFNFIRSEVMKYLVNFHDGASLLSDLLADLKEKSFQDLPKPRKLRALWVIVDQYDRAEAAYPACREGLIMQMRCLTTESLLWAVFFPVRARSLRLRPGTYLVLAVIGWCVLNAILRMTKVIP